MRNSRHDMRHTDSRRINHNPVRHANSYPNKTYETDFENVYACSRELGSYIPDVIVAHFLKTFGGIE